MKIKTFKQYLIEMPLPVGREPEEFDSKSGKYSSAKIIKKFEEMGEKIGKGSSRIAFKVMVEASQFSPALLKQYGLPLTGKVETVFKLALNAKGIAQNTSEIKHHSYMGHNDLLLPILDTSAKNKGIHWDDESLSNWIQMPVAPKPSPGQFKKLYAQMFGPRTLSTMQYTRDVDQARSIDTGGNEQQQEKFSEFLDICEELGLGIGDLGRAANWGIWNGKMYIVDYGFDDSTMNLYRGSEEANAYVDAKGNISMNIRKLPPRNRW